MSETLLTPRLEALQEIVTLADRHAITGAEIAAARQQVNTPEGKLTQQKTLVSRLFSYIGGILIFSGICIFIGMFWGDFSPAFRVLITLGTGFGAFIGAIACSRKAHLHGAVAPLFLVAAFFEPGGLTVMLNEYAAGDNIRHTILFISGLVGLQFAATYVSLRHPVLAFFALLFGGVFAAVGMDLLGMGYNIIGMGIGISYLCLATALAATLSSTRHTDFWHLIGALLLLCAFYDVVQNSAFEVTFAGLCALLVYLSIVVRSRKLLMISTIALIWYIGGYAFDLFADNGLFPLGLIIAGGVFMGLGAAAMRLDRRYIRQA